MISPRKTARRTSCTLIILSGRDICLTACGRKSSLFRAAALTKGAISLIGRGGSRHQLDGRGVLNSIVRETGAARTEVPKLAAAEAAASRSPASSPLPYDE